MSRAPKWSTFAAAALLAACAAGQALAQAESLAGCWRMQQRQERFVDGRTRDTNTDCVFDFEEARVWSRCHTPTAETERLYTYDLTRPGRIHITPLDAANGQPRGTPGDIPYRLDGPQMVTTQTNLNPVTATGQLPETITTRWIRESSDAPCKPRGNP